MKAVVMTNLETNEVTTLSEQEFRLDLLDLHNNDVEIGRKVPFLSPDLINNASLDFLIAEVLKDINKSEDQGKAQFKVKEV